MMKQTCAAVLLAALSANALAEAPVAPMDDKQKLSYVLGSNTARSLQNKQIEIDPAAFLRGMNDALSNQKSAVTEAEALEVQRKLTTDLQARAEAQAEALSAANIQAGKNFILNYKKDAKAVSLDNGMLYKVLTAGTGASPTIDSTVVAHYTGKLVDGRVFDSSVQRGQPATFPLKNVIKGWQEIVPMMKIGSKWEVVIPPQMAYGEEGPGGIIGPNSTLVFEIELLEIK